MDVNVSDIASTADNVLTSVMKVEPMVAAGVGMLVPGAAPIVAMVQPQLVMAAPFIHRALQALEKQNGGDAFSAFLDFLNHISPGRANSQVLTAANPAAAAPDASRAGSG